MKIDPKDFESTGWLYKYVRFADGVVLFTDGCSIADVQIEAPPCSAGAITVKRKHWYVTASGSDTLKLPRLPSDEKYIQKALGPKFVHDPEVQYGGYNEEADLEFLKSLLGVPEKHPFRGAEGPISKELNDQFMGILVQMDAGSRSASLAEEWSELERKVGRRVDRYEVVLNSHIGTGNDRG